MKSTKVHIEPDWLNDNLKIWFYEKHGHVLRTYKYLGDGVWEAADVVDGELSEPSMTLPSEALEALIRAAEGHVHAQDATVRHLDDAIAIRDRLLSMLEEAD